MSKAAARRRRGQSTDSKPAAPEITTFANAVRFLQDRTDFERMRIVRYDEQTFKLDRMRALLKALGNPHEEIRTIHIAGTVGKGSTVAMLTAMLRNCGYAVGEFTSPHLVDVRERVAISGKPISRPEFTEQMRDVAHAAHENGIEPTFFEVLTALAFKHFADQAVDIAVIETGLGGRLDSTNVITPLMSIVTQIDYDHTHILGRTLPEIAAEKAGILKPNIPAFMFEQDEQVEQVIRERAKEIGAPLRVINKDIEFSSRFCASRDLGPHTCVCLITDTSEFMHLPVPLPGEHQAQNCALALAAIDQLKACGFAFEELPLHQGLAATQIPGRMELIWQQPRILADGAHNPASLRALMRCVGAHVPYDSMVCIFGCCEDKNLRGMLENVALGGDKIIFTRARGNPRAVDPDELQHRFTEVSGKMSQVARTLPEAINLAARAVGRDDLICITGSFYLVGEAKKHLAEVQKKRG